MKCTWSWVLGVWVSVGVAPGCKQPEDDDKGETATATTGISVGSGVGGTTSVSGTTTSTGSGGTGVQSDFIPFEVACASLATRFEEERGKGCGSSGENAKPKKVNMLIVLDRSGSMAEDQKWSAMKNALRSALGAVENDINFGLELYPTPELGGQVIDRLSCGQVGNCCEMPSDIEMNVPVGTGADAVSTIAQTLDATEPGGGTPTTRALERALDYFTKGAGKDLEGEKYVLLATDGGPNCDSTLSCGKDMCTFNLDDAARDCTSTSADNNCCAGSGLGCVDADNVIGSIQALAQNSINTFVVGIPGSEAYSSFLNDFAEAGQQTSDDATYRYFRVDDVAELTSVFQSITRQLVTSCNLQTETVPAVGPVVVIDCEEVASQVMGAAGQSGTDPVYNWLWEPNSTQITLVGDTCTRVQQGVERIDVLLNCETIK